MDDDDFISKTRRKRQMHDLQAVGARLVALTAESLAHIELPGGGVLGIYQPKHPLPPPAPITKD